MANSFPKPSLPLRPSHKRHIKRLKILSRHPFAYPVALFLGLLLISIIGYLIFIRPDAHKSLATDTRLVIISYDHQKRVVPAKPQTVSHLLKELDIKVNPGDVVEPETDTKILQDNFRINIYRAVPVQVVSDSGISKFSFSAATTPRSIAAQAGVTVYPEDKVVAQPVTNFLKQGSVGEQVVVQHSQPVNLNLYGTAAPTRTLAKTVGGMLKEKGVKLIDGTTVTPDVTTPIADNMQVFVLAKGVSITSQEEVVPMPVQNVDDNNLTLGSRAVRQVGSPGKQVVTYQIKVDPATGQEVSRTVIQTVVTQAPVTQIVAIGKNVNIPRDKVSIMVAAGIRSSDYGYVDYIVSHEGGWDGVTKYNRSGSGAYGICQALPGSKMATAGADWATNPVTQLRWCSGYATGRYGSWAGAYNYWLSHHYW
jgi:uncharacterized protein YabE (DUF348 family)